jgi:germination protein M
MRRLFVFFLAAQITALLLAGCSLPFFGRSSGSSDKTDEIEMIALDDSPDDSGIPAADSVYASSANNDGGLYPDAGYGSSASDGTGSDGTDQGGTGSHCTGSNGDAVHDTDSSNTGSSTGGLYGTGVLGAGMSSAVAWSEPRRPVTVYYQDEDGCIIPMTRWIQPQLGIARAAVSLAIDSPLTREETSYYGVYPVIPENTGILGIDIRDGTAVIDFSRHLLNYGTAWSERNIIAAIVYTLTEFDTIDRVKILINGYSPGVLKYGTDLSDALGREDLMINAGPSLSPLGKKKLDVYFMKQTNDEFAYAVPVSLLIGSGEADTMPDTLVRLLFEGEPEGGIYTEIPDGTYLKSSYVYNGTVYLDFSSEFLNYGGTAREEAILKQIAYTLRQCDVIRKINITVEGRKVDLPEGTYISAGLVIPATVNDVIDRG